MPNADRAAVAREVLTELEQHFRDDPLQGLGATAATVVKWFRDEHYPAPPAPETVTVLTRRGVSVEWARKEQGSWHSSHGTWVPPDHLASELFDRIASDARVIQERDARIAELETQLQRALDGAVFHEKRAHHAEQERDDALRALERERAANDTRIEYGTEPRGVVISGTLEEIKGEAGATVAASEPLASESPAATSPLPAPIPLGAVVNDGRTAWAFEGDSECGFMWSQVRSSGVRGTADVAYDGERLFDALTALYRARHPVATRETVERVAKAIDAASRSYSLRGMARAALTAAGFTLEAGA